MKLNIGFDLLESRVWVNTLAPGLFTEVDPPNGLAGVADVKVKIGGELAGFETAKTLDELAAFGVCARKSNFGGVSVRGFGVVETGG